VKTGSAHLLAERYRLIARLGAGGFGEVWKAIDTRLGDEFVVAVKILLTSENLPENAVARFLQEGQILADLSRSHPGVPRVFTVEERSDRGPYMVCEFVDGKTLLETMDDTYDMTSRIEYAVELFDILDAIHSKGVLHRDLKPENLMVPAGYEGLKLIDFGIAKTATHAKVKTQEGVILGTPGYMAPEVLLGREYSRWSDLYQAALITFELITGRRAYPAKRGESPLVMLHRQLSAAPDMRLRELAPSAPASVDHVIMQCIDPNPDHRPETAALVRDALERGLEEMKIAEGSGAWGGVHAFAGRGKTAGGAGWTRAGAGDSRAGARARRSGHATAMTDAGATREALADAGTAAGIAPVARRGPETALATAVDTATADAARWRDGTRFEDTGSAAATLTNARESVDPATAKPVTRPRLALIAPSLAGAIATVVFIALGVHRLVRIDHRGSESTPPSPSRSRGTGESGLPLAAESTDAQSRFVTVAPRFEFVRDQIRLRFSTTQPAITRLVLRTAVTESTLTRESSASLHHDLNVSLLKWDGIGEPRVELTRGSSAEAVTIARALISLSRRIVSLLTTFRIQMDRHLVKLGRHRLPSDPRSLASLVPDPDVFATILGCVPWIRFALTQPLPDDVRLSLVTAISDAQVLDQLCPSRLRRGAGEIRAMLPSQFGQIIAHSVDAGSVPSCIRASRANAHVAGTQEVKIGNETYTAHEIVGEGLDGLEVSTTKGYALFSHGSSHLAEDLDAALAGRTGARSPEPSTGKFQLRIPNRMLSPGRRLVLATFHGCEHYETLYTVEINGALRLVNDGPCLPGPSNQKPNLDVWRELPAGSVHAGLNVFEVRLTCPAWWGECSGVWFSGLKIYSVANV
jgi:serine/threonine-protein kinase